jgi:hypothetical protein
VIRPARTCRRRATSHPTPIVGGVRTRHVGDDERRARLARRHGIAPAHRHPSVPAAVTAMTALHATEPATVHLALIARVDGITTADVDRALYDDRSVVKQLAMRRTLFVFPREVLPAVWGSAAARTVHTVRRNLFKDVVAAGITEDPDAWLDAARAAVRARLADGVALGAAQLRESVPELAGRVVVAPGTRYGGTFPLGPRILAALAAEGVIVRGRNTGHWRVSRPAWTLTEHWLGGPAVHADPAAGYADLVRRWLWTFGPGTEADLVWWLGATKTIVRRTLADVGAVAVTLDGGGEGWLHPDDLEPVPAVEPWAALLPVLDPTVMGWRGRGHHLAAEDVPHLFDANGNAGTTAWWDGRVVGCWVQDDAGRVQVVPLRDPGPRARAALQAEADRLTAWLDGVRVGTVYTSAAMRAARRAAT